MAERVRPTVARVDLGALKTNYRAIVQHLARGPAGTPGVIAVVKANAYGHGAAATAMAFQEAGATMLAVADIEEGVALLTHFPEFLQPNNCCSLLASRCGDKRVPALWLSEGRPKLGWCWAGNPHTWLGSASCAKRSSAVELPVAAYAK